jgi:hypothetical protein
VRRRSAQRRADSNKAEKQMPLKRSFYMEANDAARFVSAQANCQAIGATDVALRDQRLRCPSLHPRDGGRKVREQLVVGPVINQKESVMKTFVAASIFALLLVSPAARAVGGSPSDPIIIHETMNLGTVTSNPVQACIPPHPPETFWQLCASITVAPGAFSRVVTFPDAAFYENAEFSFVVTFTGTLTP